MAEEKLKFLRISRYENKKYVGGYTQPLSYGNVLIDEISEAEISTMWHVALIELTQAEFDEMGEFEGY